MKKVYLVSVFCFIFISCDRAGVNAYDLPEGFVYIEDVVNDAIVDLRYYGNDNFIGNRIDGYEGNKCIMTKETANALRKVQSELKGHGLGIKIFDAYRPQRAVNHFVEWSMDVNDTTMKDRYYPDVKKTDLIRKGYISDRSSHSRGSTVDLTIIDLSSGKELDMGSGFDYFDIKSHIVYDKLTFQQRANRLLLNVIMKKHGFRSYEQEWWHFTLMNEPYKERYFDFVVR